MATASPGPANDSVNKIVQMGADANNSTRLWIGYRKAEDRVRSFIGDPAATVYCECIGSNYFHPA